MTSFYIAVCNGVGPNCLLYVFKSLSIKRQKQIMLINGFFVTHFIFPVVESHPDNTHPDLRLDRPFAGLVQYVDALNLNAMTKQVNTLLCK